MTTDRFEVQLFHNLRTAFSLEDLRTLCFVMGLDHEGLKHDNRDVLAREMVERCRMAGRLAELRDAARRERPNLDWPNPSPAAPQVRTLVVDPLHRGDHTTISAAIAAALPGDRIEVRPGVYNEALVIDKPLEIVGQGSVEAIIVRSRENVVKMAASYAVVRNLTLRQMGGDSSGVSSSQGHLVVEECDVSSRGWACVAIYNKAMATLCKNRIHDGKLSGIRVYDHGQAVIEDNDIVRNANTGIQIGTGGNATVGKNRIQDNQQGGIFVYEQGEGIIEDNDIASNAHAGIAIRTSAKLTVARNRIYDGKLSGVLVYDHGQGVIEDNDIAGNATAGIEMRSGSDLTVRRNLIHHNKKAGILVHDWLQGVIEDNEIVDNGENGIEISGYGNLIVRKNRIHRNQQAAIWVLVGAGVFEGNDLRDNSWGSWDISESSLAHVTRIDNIE